MSISATPSTSGSVADDSAAPSSRTQGPPLRLTYSTPSTVTTSSSWSSNWRCIAESAPSITARPLPTKVSPSPATVRVRSASASTSGSARKAKNDFASSSGSNRVVVVSGRLVVVAGVVGGAGASPTGSVAGSAARESPLPQATASSNTVIDPADRIAVMFHMAVPFRRPW